MKYIHYGSDEFSIDQFEPIISFYQWYNKPIGGLWATPEQPKTIGWKEWCLQEDFHIDQLDKYFIFSLTKNAKIFSIKTINDVNKLKELIGYKDIHRICNDVSLNFNMLEEMGYDGIEVEMNDPDIYMELYGWDVDCILIFNPDIIVLE